MGLDTTERPALLLHCLPQAPTDHGTSDDLTLCPDLDLQACGGEDWSISRDWTPKGPNRHLPGQIFSAPLTEAWPRSCQWGLEDSQTWFWLNLGQHEEAEGAMRMAVPTPAGPALMEETRTQGYMHDSLHPEDHEHSSPLHRAAIRLGTPWQQVLCPLKAPLDPLFPPCTDGEPRPWFPTHRLQSLVSTRLSHVHTCLPHWGQLGGPPGLAGVTCHV